ncbi:MAG TPA: HAD family hydrolase [Candidatus Binataceae bacterium]|nr:HAD family hydrolase [Candidatus Binataceae bacterium]
MIELVIFDADGVLFDSVESNIAYYNAIFGAIGEPPLSPVEEREGIYYAAIQMFERRAGADLVKLDRMKKVARSLDSEPFFSLLRTPFELRPFMIELKRRYRLALATNRSTTVPALVDYLGLTEIFDAVASARDKVRPKPAPDILELCVRRAGVEPQRAVYVGDSHIDREAASAAGIRFIGVGERVEHHHRIAGLGELPERLATLLAESARAATSSSR